MDLFTLVCPFKVRCFVVSVSCSVFIQGAITVLAALIDRLVPNDFLMDGLLS
jgi:hypothetical protein